MDDFVVWHLIACLCISLSDVLGVTIYVNEGNNVTLTCPSTENLVILNWDDTSTQIAINNVIYNNSLPFQDRLSIVYQPTLTVYQLTISNFNGNTDEGIYRCFTTFENIIETFNIVLADGPSTASITGNTVVFADGTNSLTLTCEASTATPGISYKWENGTNVITGETDRTLTLSPAEPSYDRTVITCIATNSEFSEIQATSDPAMLTVHFGPDSASVTGSNTVYADGTNELTFSCAADGFNPGVNFQWNKGGTVVEGQNSETYTLTPVPEDDGKTVFCAATNTEQSNAQASSTSVTLNIHYGPSDVTITGNVPVFADGTSMINLLCTANYNPGIRFQWRDQNGDLSGETNSRFTKIAEQTDNGRTITCNTQNSEHLDRQEETTVTLVVYYAPSSELTIAGYEDSGILIDNGNTKTAVILSCTVADGYPEPELTWSGDACSSNGLTTPSARYVSISVEIDRSINQKSCSCIGTQDYTPWTRRKDVTFTVHFGPDTMLMTTEPDVLVEGETLTITCTRSEANPVNNITWYNGTEVLVVNSEYRHVTGVNQGTVTLQTWNKQLSWFDNGSVIKCDATNQLNEIISNSTQLDVKYGAKDITIEVKPGTPISEGDDVTVDCSCHSNPDPTFKITGPTTALTVDSKRLEIKDISRSDSGDYSCTAGNVYFEDTKKIPVEVRYPPDVTVTYATEGDTGVKFTCQAAGIPQTYNFGVWKHFAPDGQTVIRELQGDKNGDQYTLILNSVTYEDSGYYECTVNNGVHGRSTQVGQTKLSEYIVIEGPPIILENDDYVYSELGDAVNIEVSFYSIPGYTSVTWNGIDLSHMVNVILIQTTFHGESVIVAGFVTILTFDSVTADDFIPYRVVVNNTRGSASFVKTLKRITVPCTPDSEAFTAEVINKHEIKITWTGGCNGGAEQTFYIEYKKSSAAKWTLAHGITELQNGGNYSVPIYGLDPGTQYDIRIWAENAKGRSDFLYLSSETEHETSDNQTSSVAGAVIGTMVGMLVLVAVILLLLWRRGIISFKKRPSLCKQNKEPENVYRNHAFDNQDGSQSDTYQQLAPSGNPETLYDDLHNPRVTPEINGEYESLQVAAEKSQYEPLETETHRNTDSQKTADDVVYVNTKLN